jgi:hypothetical protein
MNPRKFGLQGSIVICNRVIKKYVTGKPESLAAGGNASPFVDGEGHRPSIKLFEAEHPFAIEQNAH